MKKKRKAAQEKGFTMPFFPSNPSKKWVLGTIGKYPENIQVKPKKVKKKIKRKKSGTIRETFKPTYNRRSVPTPSITLMNLRSRF